MAKFIQNLIMITTIKVYIGIVFQWKEEMNIEEIGQKKMVKHIIFSIWLLLVIGWNYGFQDAIPFDDVFVAVCLSLIATSLEKKYNG